MQTNLTKAKLTEGKLQGQADAFPHVIETRLGLGVLEQAEPPPRAVAKESKCRRKQD